MHGPSVEKSTCGQPDEVKSFLFDSYCLQCSDFDEEKFLANPHPPFFVLYSLLTRHLKSFYDRYDGDLVLAMVMCEIWHYNVGRYLDRAGPENASAILADPETRRKLLPACNAYSISQVLGVPSETVRRKVRKLVDKGWVERSKDGELIATVALETIMPDELKVEFMRGFISAARHVLAMLGTSR